MKKIFSSYILTALGLILLAQDCFSSKRSPIRRGSCGRCRMS